MLNREPLVKPTFQCGDLLLVCGRSFVSGLMAVWGAEGEVADYSHVGFVISGSPVPLVIEAVIPRVRVATVAEVIEHADHATLMRPRFLAGRESALVAAACRTIGQLYGYTKYPLYIADAVFHSDRFSQTFSVLSEYQVCSQHVGQIYHTVAYTFGENYKGLTPNEIGLWGTRHPDEWDMQKIPVA